MQQRYSGKKKSNAVTKSFAVWNQRTNGRTHKVDPVPRPARRNYFDAERRWAGEVATENIIKLLKIYYRK